MLPRREAGPTGEDGLDGEVDPEAELRARLLLYRAFRDAGARLQADARERGALFRRESSAASASAVAGSRPADGPPLDPALLAAAVEALVRIAPPAPLPPEVFARTITIAERAAIIRAALRDADSVVLQELLDGVTDRIVAVLLACRAHDAARSCRQAESGDRSWVCLPAPSGARCPSSTSPDGAEGGAAGVRDGSRPMALPGARATRITGSAAGLEALPIRCGDSAPAEEALSPSIDRGDLRYASATSR
jgi:hypothetical protein